MASWARAIAALGLGSTLAACGPSPRYIVTPATAVEVDLDRYAGTWYEIASYPQRYQKDCTNTTATYVALPPEARGDLRVVNQCWVYSSDGDSKLHTAQGRAWVVPGSKGARLELRFDWMPFRADYWILDLDHQGYQWAVVGTPKRDGLWILSRTPSISDELYADIIERLEQDGWDLDELRATDQSRNLAEHPGG